jgi:hypothetical protein
MFNQKFLMLFIGVMMIYGIAVAQKTPGDEGVAATKPLTAAIDRPKLERASYLGVATTPASAVLREQLKLKPGIGLIVEHVDQESPAEQAGLKQYDIIEKFDDQWMVNSEQLAVLIRMAEPDSEIKLTVIHQGQPQTLSAKLTQRSLPPLYSLNGVDDPSIDLSFIRTGSGTVDLADPKNPGAARLIIAGPGQMRVTSTSGEYVLTLTRENGITHLSALNRADNSQINCELDSEQDMKDMPPELVKRIRQLLSSMKISLPTTLPAAKGY